MTSNMRIWSGVQKTDPAHTKRVNQRGGFTAIDAHYQVMRATETFGPVGIGWGYECGAPIFHGDMVIVPVTLWHGDRANSFGPVYGCAQMLGQRPDTDAPKKAMTDALTKALSHLGFNADVFLGKFDDSKYVAELQREFRDGEKNENPEIEWFAAHLPGLTEADQINAVLQRAKTAGDEAKRMLAARASAIGLTFNKSTGKFEKRDAA